MAAVFILAKASRSLCLQSNKLPCLENHVMDAQPNFGTLPLNGIGSEGTPVLAAALLNEEAFNRRKRTSKAGSSDAIFPKAPNPDSCRRST
jgi:hypothetical protein